MSRRPAGCFSAGIMLIASAVIREPGVSAAILLYLVVGLVVSVPYSIWVKGKIGRGAGGADEVRRGAPGARS